MSVLLLAAAGAFAVAPTQLPDSYDWVEHGISESAAQGVDGAWPARTGFILFGLAVIWIVGLRRRCWGPLGTVLHVGFGVSMFGVAAFSARSWLDDAAYVESEDLLHSVYASVIGFCFIAGVVAVMVARRLASLKAAAPDVVALVVTSAIPLLISTGIWGLAQRIMFATAAAWYAREAWMALDVTTPALTGRSGSRVPG